MTFVLICHVWHNIMRTTEQILNGMDKVKFDMLCKYDFKFFCERMLDITELGGIHDFQSEWAIIADRSRNTVIEAPSGSSKTEIMGVCYPLWWLYRDDKKLEILLISKTVGQSEGNLLDRMKSKIMDNELLIKKLVPSDGRTSWNTKGIRTANGSTIKNVPYNVNIKGYRAHLIICDEADSYDDPDIFFKHVASRPHPGGKIILISTPEGVGNLISILKGRNPKSYEFHMTTSFKHPDGTFVMADEVNSIDDIYRLRDAGCRPIWAENEKFSFDYMAQEFESLGKWSWIQNYLCKIIGESEDAAFQLKDIVKSYEEDLQFNTVLNPDAMYFIGADFAISTGPKADFDAYVVLELLNEQMTIKHIETHKGLPRQLKVEILKNLYMKYYSPRGTRVIADKTNIGDVIINDLRTTGVTVIPQSFAGIVRLQLIQTLSNVFQADGVLRIPKNADRPTENKLINTLQNQLTGFKRTKTEKGNEIYLSKSPHDDIAISLAMAVQEAVKMNTTYVRAVSR